MFTNATLSGSAWHKRTNVIKIRIRGLTSQSHAAFHTAVPLSCYSPLVVALLKNKCINLHSFSKPILEIIRNCIALLKEDLMFACSYFSSHQRIQFVIFFPIISCHQVNKIPPLRSINRQQVETFDSQLKHHKSSRCYFLCCRMIDFLLPKVYTHSKNMKEGREIFKKDHKQMIG